ncbi:hypothetical protein [Bradyrhizobium sp. CCBAU 25338]|uniref:hypothetical protein n=1 Tax=Bradyrhizobium sp. CCBAU 25338 TaxID=1641877 RepID=UPI002302EB76|nr:hypothetical protein [Bradyrhizobium sp. CCBAU 25338]
MTGFCVLEGWERLFSLRIDRKRLLDCLEVGMKRPGRLPRKERPDKNAMAQQANPDTTKTKMMARKALFSSATNKERAETLFLHISVNDFKV